MKRILLLCCMALFCTFVPAQERQKDGGYLVNDSVKAAGIYMEVTITKTGPAQKIAARLGVSETGLQMELKNGTKQIHFSDLRYGRPIVASPGSPFEKRRFNWNYDWQYNEKYIFLIMVAPDTANKKSIYSAYVGLPKENKWKLMGTFTTRYYHYILSFGALNKIKKNYSVNFSNRWLLRNNNTWKPLDSQTTKPPVLRPMSNMDSTAQQQIEEDNLRARLPNDSVVYKDGIFYRMLKEGNGKPVNVTDTVVVHYKGWLFSDGSVFDETKEKPATFPLNRLIRGWQIGVPECKTGGKIRLYIPSGSAYGIRTFATDIPPNSTLVFDVEVLETKEKQ